MSYSTEDCKKYLISIYKNTEESGWKRIKKYKDENQIIVRDFEYSDGTMATILETPEGLKDKSLLNKPKVNKPDPNVNPFSKIRGTPTPTYMPEKKQKTEKEKFEIFMEKIVKEPIPGANNPNILDENTSSLDIMKAYLKEQEDAKKMHEDMRRIQMIFMSSDTEHQRVGPEVNQENIVIELLKDIPFKDIDTSQEKFLYVLVNGTQWNEAEGNRASTDFYFKIEESKKNQFINNLILRNVDLPNMYLLHIKSVAEIIEAQDEGYIPFHVMEGEEALNAMHDILKDIINIYEKNQKTVVFDKKTIEETLPTLEALKELCSMDEVEEKWERKDIEENLDNLINLVKSKNLKKSNKIK